MFYTKRSQELELMDKGPSHYTEAEYIDCLEKLDQVGKYLGGDRASFKAIDKTSASPATLLDVGCGGGGFTRKLGERYPHSMVVGIDISEPAIQYANAHNASDNVCFAHTELSEVPSKSYDIVITTLVCHHLKDQDLIPFLQECRRIAKKKVILNDLQRNLASLVVFRTIAPLLFRNRLITQDGTLSIKRAFTRQDWQRYLDQMHTSAEIFKKFPFRWIVRMEPL